MATIYTTGANADTDGYVFRAGKEGDSNSSYLADVEVRQTNLFSFTRSDSMKISVGLDDVDANCEVEGGKTRKIIGSRHGPSPFRIKVRCE